MLRRCQKHSLGYFEIPLVLSKKDDLSLLKKLKENANIIISKPDKGNGTVLMNRSNYIEKIDAILSDRTKFRKCGKNDDIYKNNLKVEDQVNHQLRRLKDNGSITEEEYKSLYISGSSPSVLYGLPKIHKEGTPLRPILAAFKAPTYKLAKFIISFLQPLMCNEYTLKNAYDFKDTLATRRFPKDAVMASFDITSLFTNVPIEETINIVTSSLYENENAIRNIKKADFKKLLRLCVDDNHFLFNNDHYIQYEGFAMGSPLSAPMANIFLC